MQSSSARIKRVTGSFRTPRLAAAPCLLRACKGKAMAFDYGLPAELFIHNCDCGRNCRRGISPGRPAAIAASADRLLCLYTNRRQCSSPHRNLLGRRAAALGLNLGVRFAAGCGPRNLSQTGHSRHFEREQVTSASPPIADISLHRTKRREGPGAEVKVQHTFAVVGHPAEAMAWRFRLLGYSRLAAPSARSRAPRARPTLPIRDIPRPH